MSIFPTPTAPLAIILIEFESLDIESALIGSETELNMPSKFYEPSIIS